jgi:hypothetical protein
MQKNYFLIKKLDNTGGFAHKSKCEIKKFSKTIAFCKVAQFECSDYKKIIDKYKNNENAFIFLDPPYLQSWNREYSSSAEKYDESGYENDNTVIYIYILQLLEQCKCKILFILNKNAINTYLFNKYIKGEYSKTYQGTKGKNYHLIISNYYFFGHDSEGSDNFVLNQYTQKNQITLFNHLKRINML